MLFDDLLSCPSAALHCRLALLAHTSSQDGATFSPVSELANLLQMTFFIQGCLDHRTLPFAIFIGTPASLDAVAADQMIATTFSLADI